MRLLDEAQRDELGPQVAVEANLGVILPSVQRHGGIEPRGLCASLTGGAVAARDLIGEHDLEEVQMGHAALPGQRDPFGQGVQDR